MDAGACVDAALAALGLDVADMRVRNILVVVGHRDFQRFFLIRRHGERPRKRLVYLILHERFDKIMHRPHTVALRQKVPRDGGEHKRGPAAAFAQLQRRLHAVHAGQVNVDEHDGEQVLFAGCKQAFAAVVSQHLGVQPAPLCKCD